MRYQIIALEYKADCMIPVGIPVSVFILFGRNAVDNQITGIVSVKTADNVQHSGFA